MPIVKAFTEVTNWEDTLRRSFDELYDRLQYGDKQINHLRQIDRNIFDGVHIKEFVSSILGEFARLSQAAEAYFYVDSGDELLLLHATNSPKTIKLIPVSALPSIFPITHKNQEVVDKHNWDQINILFPNALTLLMIPVWLPPDETWPPADKRFGIIILEDTKYSDKLTRFHDKTIQGFAHMVVQQLALGLRLHLKNKRTQWFRELINSFFRLDLGPYKCFKELAQKLPAYLPSFDPFQIKGKVGVSILLYHDDGKYFTIVGSTGSDIGAKIKIEDSVTGLLFEEPYKDYILGDPHHDLLLKDRYKAYTGIEGDEEAKTELVVPIKEVDGKRIAAINLDAEFEDAFTKRHVEAMIELCDIVAPIVAALHNRIIQRQTQQSAVMYAQRSYWNTVGSVLRHNTNSQLASIRMGIDNAKRAAKSNKIEKIEESLTPVYNNLNMVAEEIDQFSKEIYSYTVYGEYSIHPLISEAISKIKERAYREKRVLIDFVPDQNFQIYCSPILTMHLYNILDNSIYWVAQRLLQEPGYQAKISITVEPGPLPDKDQEQELNQTCEVIIEDNGLGCPKDALDKLLYRPVNSRRTGEEGMGHALYAVANYIYGINGDIKLESEEGQWFKTMINLPIFDDRIHQTRSSI